MVNGESSFREKYLFSEAEHKKLQSILADLQEITTSSRSLPDKTKLKLLEKLKELISNEEKEYNNLDDFWSIIGRTEIAFRVYDENQIPDKLKEMVKLIWKVQCRNEGRSPDSPPPIIIE
ncbi:MAG TPA: hypothetical protein VLB50_12725 [Ignavibacteriaceae bacterium]|nr:hypothetical protein [Ignavibacteriaceae bacterium]